MRGRKETEGWSTSARIGWFTGPREPNGCRLWMSAVNELGYPTMSVGSKTRYVTRLILGLTPADGRSKVAMHTCDNPRCVEPSHLRIGTPLDNMRDKHAKGRARYRTQISAATVAAVRAMRRAGAPLAEVVAETGVSMSHVSRIARGVSR